MGAAVPVPWPAALGARGPRGVQPLSPVRKGSCTPVNGLQASRYSQMFRLRAGGCPSGPDTPFDVDEALLHCGLGPYAEDAAVLAGCRALAATRGLYPQHVPGDDGWRACCEGLGVPQQLCTQLRAYAVNSQAQGLAADPSNAFTLSVQHGKAAPLAGAAARPDCTMLPDSLMGPELPRLLGVRAAVNSLGASVDSAPRSLPLEAHPDARAQCGEALQVRLYTKNTCTATAAQFSTRTCITCMQTLSLACMGGARYMPLMPRNAVGLLQPLRPTAEILAFQFPGAGCTAVPGAETGAGAGARSGARDCGMGTCLNIMICAQAERRPGLAATTKGPHGILRITRPRAAALRAHQERMHTKHAGLYRLVRMAALGWLVF